MSDVEDIQKLTELLATKSDISSVKEDLMELKLTAGALVSATTKFSLASKHSIKNI